MGLAEAGAAVEEERIITVTRSVNDATGGGDSEIIITTDDEIVKGVLLIKAGFVAATVFKSAGGSSAFAGDFLAGDFARANFGLNWGFNFKGEVFNFYTVIFKGGSDKVIVTVAELFDVESVFDADFNVAVFSGKQRSVLEPSGKVSGGNLLFDFSKCVFPNVVHIVCEPPFEIL